MSQEEEKPRRREPAEAEPIKYGEFFDVSGQLAKKTVAPKDAAAVRAAENMVVGHVQDGPAALMQSAADINERRGLVGRKDSTGVVKKGGVTISEAEIGGHRIITEAIGGEVLGQYILASEVKKTETSPDSPFDASANNAMTIGEALEAAGISAGDKTVDVGDVAAIQAAEVRATGRERIAVSGVAAEAQSAAAQNARTSTAEEKIKLGDVLKGATTKLVDDKPVTDEDAETVVAAETRNRPDLTTDQGGVAASVAAAAKLNRGGL